MLSFVYLATEIYLYTYTHIYVYISRVLTVYIYYRLLLHEPLDAWSDPAPQGGPGGRIGWAP